jgi:hypothetical protein
MLRRAIEVVFAEGAAVGLLRVGLGLLYFVTVCCAVRGGDAAAGQLAALVLLAVCAFGTGDWREPLRAVFAPDAALWRASDDLSWPRRLGLTAVRVVAAWFFWTCVTVGSIPHGGLIAFVPLAASALARFCRSSRPAPLR